MINSTSDWLGLAGRVCVVTGAASGIGAETARTLAAQGATLALLDNNEAALSAVTQEVQDTGGTAMFFIADVADPVSVRDAAKRFESDLGPCNVLVNNAAIQPKPQNLMNLSLDSWNQLISINLTGAFLCAQAFGAQMIRAGLGGSIINVASIGADHPLALSGSYCVSKAGLVMLTRQLALELADHGIRCNTVKPALVHTPATEALYADPEVVRKREQIIPRRRISKPYDLAQVVAFVASDRADYINGEDIAVDGGVGRMLMSMIPRPVPRTS